MVNYRLGRVLAFGQTHGRPTRLTPEHARALLARADLAMYEAKRAGGGCWRLYEDTERAADPVLPTA